MQAGAGAAPLLRNTTAARCDRISKRSIAMRVEGAVVHLPLRVTRPLCSQANNMQRKSESGDSCAPTGHEARHFNFRQIVANAGKRWHGSYIAQSADAWTCLPLCAVRSTGRVMGSEFLCPQQMLLREA